jgi:hypothetical protein
MTSFATAVEGLLEFLKKHGSDPPTRELLVVEVRPDAPTDERGRLLVGRNELRDPSDYEGRFESLMKSGLPWLNVSCVGIANGKLIVAIELPRTSPGVSTRTSVNYSGPSRVVLDNGWDAARVLVLR